jgi:hypothetical protein
MNLKIQYLKGFQCFKNLFQKKQHVLSKGIQSPNTPNSQSVFIAKFTYSKRQKHHRGPVTQQQDLAFPVNLEGRANPRPNDFYMILVVLKSTLRNLSK